MKKIMIFDDDEDILSICTYILEGEGWQVQSNLDCVDLVSKISLFKPDVIIMDNWIPDEGGVVATREIKSVDALKRIPVIYFSANSDIETLARQAGADLVFPKPFDLDALKEIVRKAQAMKL
ncbi:response regulator [Mucilaginibacter corticis]|uniref:Response regulator n=2 Tax=Mucilaginibacter corticis TaxID=2597670 RepID=A0A556M7W8_9SPHI|nr:response regulator [Mucilaginibacter corticis]